MIDYRRRSKPYVQRQMIKVKGENVFYAETLLCYLYILTNSKSILLFVLSVIFFICMDFLCLISLLLVFLKRKKENEEDTTTTTTTDERKSAISLCTSELARIFIFLFFFIFFFVLRAFCFEKEQKSRLEKIFFLQ